MTFNKKIILLIGCISTLFCILTVQDTYAKYSTSNNANADISIARWRILINDFDVRNNLTNETVIEPVFSGNANIRDGYIAPTATGYFDIIVDASETDVSFNYTLSIKENDNNQVKDLVIQGFSVDGGTMQNLVGTDITGTINYNDTNKVKNVRVYIEWNDSTGQVMNNMEDTETTSTEDALAKLNVEVKFIQIPR